MNKPFKYSAEKLEDSQIIRILKKAERGDLNEYIMSKPAVQPRGGQLFLYRDENNGKFDYRRDGYFGLRSGGDNSNKIDTEIHRWFIYYFVKNKRVHGFEREEYCLREHFKNKPRIVLVHYLGSEAIWNPMAHGNSNTGKIFTPNTSAAREQIRDEFRQTGQTPALVYDNLVKENSKRDDFPDREATDGIRDVKQAQNEKEKVDAEKRILRDQLFSVYEMIRSQRIPNFIKMYMIPDEAFILAEPQTLRLASALLKSARKDPKLPQVIGYDTTFTIFDGYVSPLVMRNTFLEKNPIFAVAYLIHERRTSAIHDLFWREMSEILFKEPLPESVPICIDREQAMINAIKKRLPGAKLVLCGNHIKSDAKFWVHKHPNSHIDDEVILPKEIDAILCSDTEQRFDEQYEYFWNTWSVPFREYVDKHLREDMRNHGAHFYTKQFPAFAKFGATNNISESCNRMIKRRKTMKKMRIDTTVLMLFNLNMSRLNDFHRAYSKFGVGRYILKHQFRKAKPPFALPPYASWKEEEFVRIVRDGVYKPNKVVEKEGNFLQGRYALAKLACKLNYVSLNSQTLSYVVTDPYSGDQNSVQERDGKVKCSCYDTGVCWHKLGYLIVTGKEMIQDRCTYSLSDMRTRTRKFKGPSGKKGPLQMEDFFDVQEAPDSKMAEERRELEDLGDIPWSEEENVTVAAPFNPKANYSLRSAMSNIREEESDLELNNENSHSFVGLSHGQEDLESNFTETLSVSTDGTTPKELALTGTIPGVKASVYSTPTYMCLRPNEELMTDIVDDMVTLMILVHGMEDKLSSTDNAIWALARDLSSTDDANELLNTMTRREPLNSSVLLITIRIDSPMHFFLAAVLYEAKEVVIINSLPSCPPDLQPVIFTILRIVAASYYVAGLDFDQHEWSFFQETNSAIQLGGSDCGLFVIVNALKIIRKRPFFTSEDVPSSEHLRAWVASCLTNKSVEKPVQLSKWKKSARLPRSDKKELITLLLSFPRQHHKVTFRSSAQHIRDAIRGKSLVDGKCGNKSCMGYKDVGRCILCTSCRSWFHVGHCCPTTVVTERFYVCSSCEENKLPLSIFPQGNTCTQQE